MDMFEMLMAKSLSGGGGAAPTLITKNITANGSYVASDDDADGYSAVSVDVANTYTAQDEGKVVSNGALVAQTDYGTVTENGTYDTTLNNSVTVNIPSLPIGMEIAKLTPISQSIISSDMYIINCATKTYIIGVVNYPTPMSDELSFNYPSEFVPNCTATQGNVYFVYADGNVSNQGSASSTAIAIDAANHKLILQKGLTTRNRPLTILFTAP